MVSASRPYTDAAQSLEIDPVAALRIAAGHRPASVTLAELWAAIDYLDRHGLSARQIALRTGCAQRTVHRRRQARQQRHGSQQ